MRGPAEKLQAEALELPIAERALLAQGLFESLDEDLADDPEAVARAWDAEIERRAGEYRAGRAATIAAADVLTEARSRLEQR